MKHMYKILVSGLMLGSLILTGAGCSKNNNGIVQTQQPNNVSDQSSSQTMLPESQPTVSDSSQTPAAVPSTATKPSPVPPQPEIKQVTIANFNFSPSSVTIKAGMIVKWTNNDSAPHSIISGNGEFKNSPVFSKGGTYQLKFDKPGIYNYSCGLHPSMQGQIIVE